MELEHWDLPSIVAANDLLSMKADMEAAGSEAVKPQKDGGSK